MTAGPPSIYARTKGGRSPDPGSQEPEVEPGARAASLTVLRVTQTVAAFVAVSHRGGAQAMSSWKVVVTAVTFAKASPEPLDRLRAAGCEVVTNPWGRPLTEAELLEAVAEADALIVGNDKVSAAVINAAPRLKIIAKHGVGYDNIDRKAAAARGILVTNAPGTNSHEVADLAFGLLHMLARGLHIAIEATKQGKWIKPMGIGLWGKTLGIVGVGRIGTAVAARARGYGGVAKSP